MNDLTLICYKCRFPIDGDTGCLRVAFADIHKYRDQERAYQQQHPEGSAVDLLDFLTGPEPVHWRAYHTKCDPDPEDDFYGIRAERLRTWQQLCWWTAHLMEKNWFANTDWDCLLRALSGEGNATTIKVLARSA